MYFVYGIKGMHCEALYSILSYLKHNTANLAQNNLIDSEKVFAKELETKTKAYLKSFNDSLINNKMSNIIAQ